MTDPSQDNDWLDSEMAGDRVRIHVPMNVPPWILLGGGKQTLAMEVEGEAKILTVNVPPSSQPGQILRLRKVMFGLQQVDLYIELQGIAIQPQMLVVAGAVVVAVGVMVLTLLMGAGG